MKEIHIIVTKCLLILDENELMQCLALKPELLQKAIGRGKGYRRLQRAEQFKT